MKNGRPTGAKQLLRKKQSGIKIIPDFFMFKTMFTQEERAHSFAFDISAPALRVHRPALSESECFIGSKIRFCGLFFGFKDYKFLKHEVRIESKDVYLINAFFES